MEGYILQRMDKAYIQSSYHVQWFKPLMRDGHLLDTGHLQGRYSKAV